MKPDASLSRWSLKAEGTDSKLLCANRPKLPAKCGNVFGAWNLELRGKVREKRLTSPAVKAEIVFVELGSS
jgi:hypothetical protein